MEAFSSSPQQPNPSRPQPTPSSSTASRRLPPPCWSNDETEALIDAYRNKWYSLRRGNLKAQHWQEVADDLAARCPPLAPGISPKTSVQCRHKMEKLRKRYRTELQRAAAIPTGSHRYASTWVHFRRMDSMEKGPTAVAVPLNKAPIDEEDEDDEEYRGNIYPKSMKIRASHSRPVHGSTNFGVNGNGFRSRAPGRSNMVFPSMAKSYSTKFDDFSTPSPESSPNVRSIGNLKNGCTGRSGTEKNGGGSERLEKRKIENDPATELVAAFKVFGDGYVRIEKMKMEMAKEIEAMRMEMEVKRTEMILESEQRILESFAKAMTETNNNKNAKRMPSSES